MMIKHNQQHNIGLFNMPEYFQKNNKNNNGIASQCVICQSTFTCDVAQGNSSCWCNAFPPFMHITSAQNCYCRVCLSQMMAKRIQSFIQDNGLKAMLTIARPYFDPNTLLEYVDYTVEQGNYVFSAWYHLKRGKCCGNGCRHCPYQRLAKE